MSVRWLSFYALLLILILVLGGLYVWFEAILTKGPNDWGAQTHALSLVQEKYGPGATINTVDYKFHRDTPESSSGTYIFQYDNGGKKGKVVCHYDKATGTFNGDGVMPGK